MKKKYTKTHLKECNQGFCYLIFLRNSFVIICTFYGHMYFIYIRVHNYIK
jgi:hypothetical protein